MGILQIGLIIWAWKRGWKAWALLPFGGAFSVGFVVGFMQGFSGVVYEGCDALYLLADLIALVALVAMIIMGREPLESSVSANRNDVSVARHRLQPH